MLTILYPALIPHIASYPAGLYPLILKQDKRMVLIIKATKETILTAKMNRGFRFYLAPVESDGIRTLSIFTAFFDDDDNPLFLWTPLIAGDDLTSLLCQFLTSKSFDVHFFDENNRELLGYRAHSEDDGKFKAKLAGVQFFPFSHDLLRKLYDQSMSWLANRTAIDDAQALDITFGEALVPEDLFIQDLTEMDFHGSTGFGYTSLERDGDPGAYQERDIVKLLQRVFPSEEIYLNPFKIEDARELVDVLVVSKYYVLLIQGKDSPNTEKSLQRSICRKIKTVESQLDKAVRQLRGSISYVQIHDPLKLTCKGGSFEVELKGRIVWGLIVLNEIFDTEYSTYSPPVLELARESGVPCLLLDFHELHNFTHHRDTEAELLASFQKTFEFANLHNRFPRNRFGFVPPEHE